MVKWIWRISLGVLIGFLFVAHSYADDYYWSGRGGDEDWHNGANWFHGGFLTGVPPDGSDVHIVGTLDAYQVAYAYWNGLEHAYNSLSMNASGMGIYAVTMTVDYPYQGHNLYFDDVVIAGAGEATLNIKRGQFRATTAKVNMGGYIQMSNPLSTPEFVCFNSMTIGDQEIPTRSEARYYQSDGTFWGPTADVTVGAESSNSGITGSIRLDGGHMYVHSLEVKPYGSVLQENGWMHIGTTSSLNTLIDRGMYVLDNGILDLGLNISSQELIGGSMMDPAYFYHNGGDNKTAILFVGPNAGFGASYGIYEYNGGRFTFSGPSGTDYNLQAMYLGGDYSAGEFKHKAIDSLIVNTHIIAHGRRSFGRYTLYDSAYLKDYNLYIGYRDGAHGFFTNEGGTHVVAGSFILADGNDSQASYEILGDGSLQLRGASIGAGGEGFFYQRDNSQVTVSSALNIAHGSGVTDSTRGRYSLYGGNLTSNDIYIGSNTYGQGSFYQYGGNVTVDNSLYIFSNSRHKSYYSLQGGSLSANYEHIDGYFYHTSGTNHTNSMDIFANGVYNLEAGAYLYSRSKITLWSGGTLNIKGGRLHITSYYLNNHWGNIVGYGTIEGSVFNDYGNLEVGFGGGNTGELYVTEGLRLLESSTLLFDIAGYTQGSEYDYLYVGLVAALNGRLAVNLWNGFDPAVGSVFDLIYVDRWGLSGTFSILDLPNLGPDKYWEPVYTNHKFSLYVKGRVPNNVVPEPVSAVLFSIGILGIAFRKRK